MSSNLNISWQEFSSTAGLVLQMNFDLAGTNWFAVTNHTTLNNGFYQMTISRSYTSNQFYRLANQ